MTTSARPTQQAIVLQRLAWAGEKGISSYLAYDPNFKVKRLAARIWELQRMGAKIDHKRAKEARYFLRSVTPELCARKQFKNIPELDHYLIIDLGARLTPIEQKIATDRGDLVPVFEGNSVRFVPKKDIIR